MSNDYLQAFLECTPILIAMLLEFIPFPSKQKLKDSVVALGRDLDIPEEKHPDIENLSDGVASAASVAPTLVAAMATVVTIKDDHVTLVMFCLLAICVVIYSLYLSRSLYRLTDRVPVPKFYSRRNPEKSAWNFTWASLISRLNLAVDFILLALVIYSDLLKEVHWSQLFSVAKGC